MKLQTLISILSIIVIIGTIIIFLKWDDWQKPNIKLTLSNSMVTFPNDETGKDIAIGPEEIKTMTDSELVCYSALIYYIERFHMTQEETQYIGKRLLPRFFQQQTGEKTE